MNIMTLDKTAPTRLLAAVVEATVAAGFIVWDHFCRTSVVEYKSDSSPVTEADRAAEVVILAALRAVAPEIPVVAEEEAAAGRVPDVGEAFFLVDPLDGTKEFIQRGTDFTVNVGLDRKWRAHDGRASMRRRAPRCIGATASRSRLGGRPSLRTASRRCAADQRA